MVGRNKLTVIYNDNNFGYKENEFGRILVTDSNA